MAASVGFVDRMIGYVAPGLAERRLDARVRLDAKRTFLDRRDAGQAEAAQRREKFTEARSKALQAADSLQSFRGYDVGRYNPQIPWSSYSSLSATDEILGSITRARQLVRDTMRNDSIGKHALRVWVDTILGSGISPRSDSADENDDRKDQTDELVQQLWQDWAETTAIDAYGLLDYYGLVDLWMKMVGADGEAIVIKRWRNRKDVEALGLPHPLQLETIEGDWLADTVTSWPTRGGGSNTVIGGVELDKNRRRVAYHFYTSDPAYGLSDTVRVEAKYVLHFFGVDRPGQQRGISCFVGSIGTLYDLQDISDATLKRAKLETALMMILGVPQGSDRAASTVGNADPWASGVEVAAGDPFAAHQPLASGYAIETAAGGSPFETVQSGQIGRVARGTEVNVVEPKASNGQEVYTKIALRRVAAGPGVLYEAVSGDYSDVNYSSGRLAMAPVQRAAQKWRDQLVARVLGDVWRDFITGCYTMYAWDLGGIAPDRINYKEVSWVMPKADSPDPEKDADAVQAKLSNGSLEFGDMIVAEGDNVRQRAKRMKKTRDVFASYGIDIDKFIFGGKKDGTAGVQPASDDQQGVSE